MAIKKINSLWEERSKKYKTDPRGVLPKFLTPALLKYLDDWMYHQVKSVLAKKRKLRVLDLGCGYGRLASKIVKDYPGSYVSGVDISQEYVDLFNQELKENGNAIRADIKKLPFVDSSFDVIIAVTTLMYMVNERDQIKAMKEIFRLLKKDGRFVIIERNPTGHSLITLGGLLTALRGQENREIESVGFTPQEMKSLISTFGGSLQAVCGMPFWTLLLPLEFILSYIPFSEKFFRAVETLDKVFDFLLTPSLYISYIGGRQEK